MCERIIAVPSSIERVSCGVMIESFFDVEKSWRVKEKVSRGVEDRL